MSTYSIDKLDSMIEKIIRIDNLPYFQKINALTQLYEENKENLLNSDKNILNKLENAIEDQFGTEIRRLNAIRESNLESPNTNEIQKLKNGYAQLFKCIENTFGWNSERNQSLYGVINRASLRAMLIDPEVSIKQKQEIMDNWEDYL